MRLPDPSDPSPRASGSRHASTPRLAATLPLLSVLFFSLLTWLTAAPLVRFSSLYSVFSLLTFLAGSLLLFLLLPSLFTKPPGRRHPRVSHPHALTLSLILRGSPRMAAWTDARRSRGPLHTGGHSTADLNPRRSPFASYRPPFAWRSLRLEDPLNFCCCQRRSFLEGGRLRREI